MHILVEPEAVEIIAQVVVEGDIVARSATTVATCPMRQAPGPAGGAAWPGSLAQRHRIRHEQREERHRVGTGPFARRPGAIPTGRTTRRQSQQRAPVQQVHRAFRPRRASAQQPARAIRQGGVDRPLLQSLVDAIEQAVKLRADHAGERTDGPRSRRAQHGQGALAAPGIDRIHDVNLASSRAGLQSSLNVAIGGQRAFAAFAMADNLCRMGLRADAMGVGVMNMGV